MKTLTEILYLSKTADLYAANNLRIGVFQSSSFTGYLYLSCRVSGTIVFDPRYWEILKLYLQDLLKGKTNPKIPMHIDGKAIGFLDLGKDRVSISKGMTTLILDLDEVNALIKVLHALSESP